MRLTWDETWSIVAQTVARRSRCDRAQCGAVIVDPTNRIVATGYNGPPADLALTMDGTCSSFCPRAQHGATPETALTYDDCPALHAEANALMFCDRREREGGTLYVSGWPCVACSKLIANSGLKRVVILVESTDRSYRQPEKGVTLLQMSGIEVVTR